MPGTVDSEVAQPRPTSPGLARPSPTPPCRCGWVWLGAAGCGWARLAGWRCGIGTGAFFLLGRTVEEHYPGYGHGTHSCSTAATTAAAVVSAGAPRRPNLYNKKWETEHAKLPLVDFPGMSFSLFETSVFLISGLGGKNPSEYHIEVRKNIRL